MSTKNISVRLGSEGGKQLKADLHGVGESGKRNLRKISREAEIANARLAKLASRAKIAGRIIGVALVAGVTAALRSSLNLIDSQAKLAASLRTTTASIQVLSRAGDLAGVSMGQVEQATIQLTKRLSQAVTGTGPAVQALNNLHLSAQALSELPLDARISTIQDAISKFIPEAEQAAVASQIFGDRAGLIFTRIDSSTLRQAAQDVRDLGVAVSDSDAAQVQRTNDALSRMGLLWRGIANQLAVAAAPALEAISRALVNVGKVTGPVGRAIKGLFNNIGEITTIVATFAAVIGGKLVLKLAAAVLGISKATTALGVLRGAIIRTGIGALIVGAGELIYWMGKLSDATGGWGNAVVTVGMVVKEAFANWQLIMGLMWEAWRSGANSWYISFLEILQSASKGVVDFVNKSAQGFQIIGHLMLNPNEEQSSFDAYVAGLRNAAPLIGDFSSAIAGARANMDDANGSMIAIQNALKESSPKYLALVELMDSLAASGDVSSDVLESFNNILKHTPQLAGGAGDAGTDAGDRVKTAWESARDAIAAYAKEAKNAGSKVGEVFTSAFSKAGDIIAKFVETGKFSFKDLANSIIADLTRIVIKKQILGPLAEALNGIFDGGGGGFLGGLLGGGAAPVPVNHAGGMVGGIGPSRMMPAAAFASAPRMHNGGWAGLRPDEIPTILQKGERVLSRREVAAGAGGGGAAPIVNVTIVANDVESFRRSRTQIAADLAQAVQHGQRGL